MLSVIILDNGEPNVIKLTYENLWKELKDIVDTELLVSDSWFKPLSKIKNKYVCFVEPDCLVNSGYFASQIGLFKKNPYFRKLAMLSSAVAVNNWANKFYGYSMGNNYSEGIIPNRQKKSTSVYPVQVGYVPGAVIRMSMLIPTLKVLNLADGVHNDLVYFSTTLSFAFWSQGDGNRVHINPNTTYVTTEDYVNDIYKTSHTGASLVDMFAKESI